MEEKVVLKEVWIEHEGERRRIDRLEKILEEVFQTILDSVLTGENNAEEKLKKITQTMDEYKQ